MKNIILKTILTCICLTTISYNIMLNLDIQTIANLNFYTTFISIYILTILLLHETSNIKSIYKNIYSSIVEIHNYRLIVEHIYKSSKAYVRHGREGLLKHIKSVPVNTLLEQSLLKICENTDFEDLTAFFKVKTNEISKKKDDVLLFLKENPKYIVSASVLSSIINYNALDKEAIVLIAIISIISHTFNIVVKNKILSYYKNWEIYSDMVKVGCLGVLEKDNSASIVHKLIDVCPYNIDFELNQRPTKQIKIGASKKSETINEPNDFVKSFL